MPRPDPNTKRLPHGAPITEEYFERVMGYKPNTAELEIANCKELGPAHTSCGWNYNRQEPKHLLHFRSKVLRTA